MQFIASPKANLNGTPGKVLYPEKKNVKAFDTSHQYSRVFLFEPTQTSRLLSETPLIDHFYIYQIQPCEKERIQLVNISISRVSERDLRLKSTNIIGHGLS